MDGTGGVALTPGGDTAVPPAVGDAASEAMIGDAAPPPALPPATAVNCANLPKLPLPYRVRKGPKSAEDFAFDREGFMISVPGDLFKTPFMGPSKLVSPTRFMQTHGIRLLPGGDLLVIESNTGSIWRVTTDGTKRKIASGFRFPNGMEIGIDGFAYVSDVETQRILRVNPDTGASTIVVRDSGMEGPNGLSFSPDYKTLYLTDHWAKKIFAIDMKPDNTGTIRLLAPKPGQPELSELDGIAVDACGNLYVTEIRTGQLWRVSPTGDLALAADKMALWLPNAQFGSGIGGWDPKVLYVIAMEGDTVFEVEAGVPGKIMAHLMPPR